VPVPKRPQRPIRPPVSDERLSEILDALSRGLGVSPAFTEDLRTICVELEERRRRANGLTRT
jgi:hypothetical protein